MKLSYIGFAALLLLASGCRDTSSPSKALLGHWVTTSDGIEIHRCYSSDSSAIYFNKTQDNLERLS